MKKLITLLILMMATASSLLAVDFEYEGLKYTVLSEEDKTCEVSGYVEDITGNVIMPSEVVFNEISYTVVSIGSNSFADCEEMTSLTIPNSVTTIQEWAFHDSGLTSIMIPASVTSIGTGSFVRCYSLTEINVDEDNPTYSSVNGVLYSKSQNAILQYPLGLKTNENYEIPNTVNKIGDWCFANCDFLNSISISNSAITIGEYAFYSCSSISNIEIPNSVTKIGNWAFRDCRGLTSVDIPNSVTTIGNDAFSECYNLNSITLPASIKEAKGHLFAGCARNLKVSCHASVPPANFFQYPRETTTPEYDCIYLIGTPNSWADPTEKNADVLAEWRLLPCEGMGSVYYATFDLPASPMFRFYTKLEGFNGSNVSLGWGYYDFTELECNDISDIFQRNLVWGKSSFSFPELEPGKWTLIVDLNNIGFPGSVGNFIMRKGEYTPSLQDISPSLYVPKGTKEAYAAAEGWKEFEIIIDNLAPTSSDNDVINYRIIDEDELTCEVAENSVAEGAVVIPEYANLNGRSYKVISIAENAFAGCNLTSVSIPNSVISIGDKAFAGNKSLTSIRCMATVPPHAELSTFPTTIYENTTVTVPEQSLKLYTREYPWNRFRNYLTTNNGISLSHYEVEMAADEVFQLGIYNAEDNATWTSSNPDVAYANDCGLIVAKGITGTTEISANVQGEKLSCRVLVSTPTRGERLEKARARISPSTDVEDIEPTKITIESISGNPPMLNVRLHPVGACTVLDWKSSDESLATVDHGFINVHGDGDVDFTTTTENGLEHTYTATAGNGAVTGIEDILVDNAATTNNVYDLTGRCVIINATQEQINTLNKGVYIVNGKKILVK